MNTKFIQPNLMITYFKNLRKGRAFTIVTTVKNKQ